MVRTSRSSGAPVWGHSLIVVNGLVLEEDKKLDGWLRHAGRRRVSGSLFLPFTCVMDFRLHVVLDGDDRFVRLAVPDGEDLDLAAPEARQVVVERACAEAVLQERALLLEMRFGHQLSQVVASIGG